MFASFNARAVGLPHLPTDETIEVARLAGFDGVDLMVRDIVRGGLDPARVRDRLDAAGLVAGAFPMTMDWRGSRADFDRDLAELPKLADAARTMGLSRTGTWVMPELPSRSIGRAEVAELHRNRLGAIARILADHEIRLGLEVIGVRSFRSGRGETFVARMADLERELPGLVEQEPNMGLLVDAFHLHAADEPVEAALAWGVDRIVWAHVADLPAGARVDRDAIVDADRGLPGDHGAVESRALLAALARGGFGGPVTTEPLGRCLSLVGKDAASVARLVRASLGLIWPEA